MNKKLVNKEYYFILNVTGLMLHDVYHFFCLPIPHSHKHLSIGVPFSTL